MPQRRRALVTGGSSGIGRCIARTLAAEGFDVGILYLGSAEDARPVLDEIEANGSRASSWLCNVADAAQVHQAFEAYLRHFGGLDVLINNAGIARDAVSWKMTDEQWREVIDVNLTGAFNCARAAIAPLRAVGGGAIVNITSINGLRGKFGQANYAAAKAGLVGLTKTLARELARSNITVNAVAPGMIRTLMVEQLPDEIKQQALGEILLGRIGEPQEVADLVSFLCGPRARFITGEVIKVDGGQYV